MAELITTRYADRLHGVLSCVDRIVITGSLPVFCYPAGMSSFCEVREFIITPALAQADI